MARMLTMTLIAFGLIVAFQVAGIDVGLSQFADIFGVATGDITVSDFFSSLFGSTSGILILLGAGSIVAGLFARGQLENFIVLPFLIGTISIMAGVFVQLIQYTQNFSTEFAWMGNTMLLIMGLFSVAYIITMVEWFRGNV